MKIAIDLDEVIANQIEQLVKFYYKKTGKLISKDKFHTYYWPDVWKIPLQDAIKIDKEFKESEFYDKIEPFENAVDSTKKLIKDNEIFIITARSVIFREKTDIWIKKHLNGIPLKLIHSGDFDIDNKPRKKSEICKELGIKIILEDDRRYALDCANSRIKVILFDQPWNKNISHKNIIRVSNWVEALKEIEKILEQKIK